MSQQQQQQQQNNVVRAMAWDPTCPASLCLLNATTNDAAAAASMSVDCWYSDTGSMSCNAHELAALYAILKAHEAYHADMHMLQHEEAQADAHHGLRTAGGSCMSILEAFTSLSRACRAAVLQCCEGWEQEIMQQQQQQDVADGNVNNNNNTLITESVQNLDLLKTMHAILHLSDVFLPLLPMAASSSGGMMNINDMYDIQEQDAFEKPGAVTADTIRYLRYNHLDYANALHPAIHEMLSLESPSSHPEEYQVEMEMESEHDSNKTITTRTVNLYWWYISTLVKRGCLEQAWETLQLHSLYRAAVNAAAAAVVDRHQDDDADGFLETENDAYYMRAMKDVRHGFYILRMILLRAPLPAGRNDEYDTALGTPDFEDADDNDIDSADCYQGNDNEDDYNNHNLHLQGLDVSSRDYKYWEVSPSAGAPGTVGLDDLPMNYSPQVAMRKHQTWQRFVQDLRPNFGLSRRIPELDRNVLAILAGDFDNAYYQNNDNGKNHVTFVNWTERLCAELLYKRPNLSPRELHIVTRRTMKQFMGINISNNSSGRSGSSNRQMKKNNNENDDTTTTTTEQLLMERSPMAVAILQIMQGHAGQAIETMYLLGGGSGAALPATLTAILYTMFLESSIMPPESAFRKTEFICQAASAIVSSLGGGGLDSKKQHVHDVGAHLAIQLLLPYTWATTTNNDNDGGDEYGGGGDDKTARSQIIALIANILEHYNPRSESAARDLIDTCMPLLAEQQSVVILEACVSIVLCRYRKALKDQDDHEDASYSRTAMQWLWQGMQLEAMVLQPAAAMTMGSCHCTLSSWCYQTAFDLVNSSAKVSVVHPLIFQAATEMVNAVREAALGGDDGSGGGGTHRVSPLKIAPVRQLICIQELFDTFSLQGDYAGAARQIVDSLQETTTSSDGTAGIVATLVPFSMYLPLLQIAQQMLVREEATHEWNTQNPSCAFDRWGVSVLMQTLTRVTTFSSSLSSTSTGTTVMTEQQELELSQLLARALARAFVAENAKKKNSLAAQQQQQQQQQHAHGGVDIASIRSVHLAQHPPSIQEAVVQRMLDM